MTERNGLSRAVLSKAERLRNARGWTQSEMATALTKAGFPITRANWSNLPRRSSARIDLDMAVALAAVFKMSLDDLVSLSEPPCDQCLGYPPVGFVCEKCGRSGSAVRLD